MKNLQNLHTHTTFCDGKNTPDEMVQFALSKGFDSIGFSGHSYMSFSKGYSMSLEGTEEYKKEITALKEKYKDQIEIFLGLEYEMYSGFGLPCGFDLSGYDYLIGSSHYLKFDNEVVGFDRDAVTVREVIDKYFGGNGLNFAKKYYEDFSQIYTMGKFDILGHIDIISKTVEQISHFDENSEEYLKYAYDCIASLKGKIPLFEVNTGAISRGYKKVPYPILPILRELYRQGFGAVISSDCHNGEFLDCDFENARELLKTVGFKERYILTKTGFKAVEV